ncbi:MAG: hypothetical protein WA125_06450 [Desulfosporosinus sp.]
MENNGTYKRTGRKDSFPDQTSVLQNSLLVTKLIIQEGLNDSGLAWSETVFDLLDNVLKYLEQGSLDWLISFKEVARYSEAGTLSKLLETRI